MDFGQVKDHRLVANKVGTSHALFLIDVLLLFFIKAINQIFHPHRCRLCLVDEGTVRIGPRIHTFLDFGIGFGRSTFVLANVLNSRVGVVLLRGLREVWLQRQS